MPNPFPGSLRALAGLFSAALLGCFGSEPDDSPYTVPKGESYEALQLELETDGTVLVLAQAAMYLGHSHPAHPGEASAQIQNFRSILHRRSGGEWKATAFKNLQESPSAFPALLPGPDGACQAFLWDGGLIKRYAYGNGSWIRRPGTDWPAWFHPQGNTLWYHPQGNTFGSRNWTRHPGIAVAGESLLLTLHQHWEDGWWATESGSSRKTHLDSLWFSPKAVHAGKEFRALVGSHPTGQRISPDKDDITSLVQYYHWKPGSDSARKFTLGTGSHLDEAFFSPYRGGFGLFLTGKEHTLIYPLDAQGFPSVPDTVPMPGYDNPSRIIQHPLVAADTAGCLHVLDYVLDSSYKNPDYVHWNSCSGEAPDTLVIPKPKASADYFGLSAKLRIALDGTPVIAVILREVDSAYHVEKAPSSHLFVAERRGGRWLLDKVDERPSPLSAAKTAGQGGGF